MAVFLVGARRFATKRNLDLDIAGVVAQIQRKSGAHTRLRFLEMKLAKSGLLIWGCALADF
jgi:hypothetical protein